MPDWILSIEPEGWAAIIAVGLAALSLGSQARSQRLQARMALLERRFGVFDAMAELLRASKALGMLRALGPVRMPDDDGVLIEQVHEHEENLARARARRDAALPALASVKSAAPLLFGPDVSVLITAVEHYAQAVDVGDEFIELFSPDALAARVYRGNLLNERIVATCMPYLGRERFAGLGWLRQVISGRSAPTSEIDIRRAALAFDAQLSAQIRDRTRLNVGGHGGPSNREPE